MFQEMLYTILFNSSSTSTGYLISLGTNNGIVGFIKSVPNANTIFSLEFYDGFLYGLYLANKFEYFSFNLADNTTFQTFESSLEINLIPKNPNTNL